MLYAQQMDVEKLQLAMSAMKSQKGDCFSDAHL